MLDFAKLIHEAIGIESPRAFIALFALVGLLFFGGVGWLVDKGYRAKLKETTQATESLPSGPDRKTEERIFLPPDIDCNYLTGLYETHTAMQADQLAASYVGKWMRMTVVVENVDYEKFENAYRIYSYIDDSRTTITMRFSAQWSDRISVLRRGSKITVVGALQRANSRTLRLDRCELES